MCVWRLLISLCCGTLLLLAALAFTLNHTAPRHHTEHAADTLAHRAEAAWDSTKAEYAHVVHVAHAAAALRSALKSESSPSSHARDHHHRHDANESGSGGRSARRPRRAVAGDEASFT